MMWSENVFVLSLLIGCLVGIESFPNYQNNPFLTNVVPPVAAVPPVSAVPLVSAVPPIGLPYDKVQSNPSLQQQNQINFIETTHSSNNPNLVSPYSPPNIPNISNQIGNNLKQYCLKLRGQFPSKYCNKFVNCWDDVVVEQFCPKELVFNPKGFCDYPYNVNCSDRQIEAFPQVIGTFDDGHWKPPVPPPVQPTYIPQLPQTPSASGLPTLTNPPIVSNPPISSVVTVPTIISNPPSVPSVPPVTVTLPTIPAKPVTEASLPIYADSLKRQCLKPRGQFPSSACNKYVNCWDDIVIEQECAPGLLFNEKGYCDFSYNVNCHNRTSSPRNSETPCPASDGTFRSKNSCSSYFVCSANQIVATYQCQNGLLYNNIAGICDYAYRVNCNEASFNRNQLTYNYVDQLPEELLEATVNCITNKVYPLNPQCTSASICKKGFAEIVHCPPGLAYDSSTNKCLEMRLAKC